MANDKEHLHNLALDLYRLHDRNLSNVARDERMPSRQTLITWKKQGCPETRTGGKDWDTYLDDMESAEVERAARREIARQRGVMDNARETIEIAIDRIREKIEDGDFEAKPSDLDKLIRLWASMDQRDAEKKAWMDSVMVAMIAVVAEVVSPQQLAVIRARFLDLNTSKTEPLDLLEAPRLPDLSVPQDDKEEPTDAVIIEQVDHVYGEA